jgi:hypothetical protein
MQALQDAVEKAKRDQAKYDNQYNQALVHLTNSRVMSENDARNCKNNTNPN